MEKSEAVPDFQQAQFAKKCLLLRIEDTFRAIQLFQTIISQMRKQNP